jgi:hypothetical protein
MWRLLVPGASFVEFLPWPPSRAAAGYWSLKPASTRRRRMDFKMRHYRAVQTPGEGPPAGGPAAVGEADAEALAAKAIGDEGARADALGSLAPQLSPEQIGEGGTRRDTAPRPCQPSFM